MINALRILRALDERLNTNVELTLYGRAALQLGFDDPPTEYAMSQDVDAVLWLGQAEELNQTTNFWRSMDEVNQVLADRGLFISHFFVEDQVILTPEWRSNRIRIPGDWQKLVLYRLGDEDLLLSKLMRDDPIDQADARFIVSRAGMAKDDVERSVQRARVPNIPEIAEQFERATRRLLDSI
jgi:hypothetical protein